MNRICVGHSPLGALVCAGVLATSLHASGPIFPGLMISLGHVPTDSILADFDGDGLLDLMVAHRDPQLRVFQGLGRGEFAEKMPLNTGVAERLGVADMDGDGLLDLVVLGPNGLDLYHGNGDLTFRVGDSIAVDRLVDMAIADLNGDGRPDVVAITWDGHAFAFVARDGSYIESWRHEIADNSTSMLTTDVNGDMFADLIIVVPRQQTVLHLGLGDGTFDDGRSIKALAGVANNLVSGDFNDDSIVDLGVETDLGAAVVLGRGDGSFVAGGSVDLGHTELRDIASGDFDGDGWLDLALVDKLANDESHVYIVLGDGAGGLEHVFSTRPLSNGLAAISVGDLTSDGKPDLIAIDLYEDRAHVLISNGDGTVAAPTIIDLPERPGAMDVGDVNGDGYPDFAYGDLSHNDIRILLNDCEGGFAESFHVPLGFYAGFALVRVDHDPFADLVTSEEGTIGVRRGVGDGTLGPPQYYDTTGELLAMDDVNADGDIDVISVNEDLGVVIVMLGDGLGGFSEPIASSTVDKPVHIASADLNADGRPDLAITSELQEIAILIGNGDGSYQRADLYPTGIEPGPIAISDINLDGHQDIIVANFGSHDLSVLHGLGDGRFEVMARIDSVYEPSGLIARDLDGDGDPDLCIAQWREPLLILVNNGEGDLSQRVPLFAAEYKWFVEAEDLDLDGDVDLVTSGAFLPESIWIFTNGLIDGCAGDVDGDGDADAEDFFAFLDAFASGNIDVCDIDGSGVCDIEDFFAFLDRFGLGCS